MGTLMVAMAVWYFGRLGVSAWLPGHSLPMGDLVAYLFLTITGSIVVQVLLAIANRGEAGAAPDERENAASARAVAWAGHVLTAVIAGALLWFMAHRDGMMLFHSLFAGLLASQTVVHWGTAWLLRRGF
ncbi:hypothetical protein [Sandarakinorhabdus sp. AAP62]|uniref:hypothetical protein n=1 Tax=Sandarakinorhabdus sp. AAP62 TaxID=1248916 RepID=UPI00126726C0|nr:hypothetical protein [Sandarakinorhabdus sp. AAP62]